MVNAQIVKHPCTVCQAQVWPDSSHPNVVYCSDRCKYEAMKGRFNKTVTETCPICLKQFSGNASRMRKRVYDCRACFYTSLSLDMRAKV